MRGASHGRLGNRLWTLANLLAYAIEKQFTLVAPPYSDFKSLIALRRTRRLGWAGKLDISAYRVNSKLPLFPTLLLNEGELLDLDHDADLEPLHV